MDAYTLADAARRKSALGHGWRLYWGQIECQAHGYGRRVASTGACAECSGVAAPTPAELRALVRSRRLALTYERAVAALAVGAAMPVSAGKLSRLRDAVRYVGRTLGRGFRIESVGGRRQVVRHS